MYLALLFLILIIGSCLQRVSGMGLGLVAGPFLAVFFGPVEGILVINVLAFINAAMTTLTVRKYVDWCKVALISSVLIFGSVPAALLIRVVSPGVLQVLVGGLLLVALAVVTFGQSRIPRASGRIPAVTAGVVGGFMNTLAGIAGPAITVYAQMARWDQRTYAATLQPIFMVAGAISFIIKLLMAAATLHVDWRIWPVGVAAMLIGIGSGIIVSKYVAKKQARRIALALAAGGGLIAVVRGAMSLV
ncbi:sulfite exporter TauE/SafE family protein [Corynebacterium halotolerans]|uniref:sulfite exporter TauE/SafE family protein n=1 Tax=Corynebacterium halotolerans TaxID=225326 RepID=UPI000478F5BC|nr:sulfite exporter TauE/SafE family protein [Corynebacterium halotolerans]